MTKFNSLKPIHKWLTHRHPVLPIVAVVLATMLWFSLDADAFALLQGLLLVLVVTGRTARSSQETPEDLSLLELPFALAAMSMRSHATSPCLSHWQESAEHSTQSFVSWLWNHWMTRIAASTRWPMDS